MMNRKVWPVLLIVLFGGIFWAFTGKGGEKDSEDQYAQQQKVAYNYWNYTGRKALQPKTN